MPRDLPSGTVTFLFTDVEGSTKLLHELGDAAYAAALDEHRAIVRTAFAAHGGVEVDTQGDAFFVAFATAQGALEAARDGLRALSRTRIVVRIGLHTGTPVVTSEGYVGEDVHRAARIAASGHGGQILVSEATAALVGEDGLTDLGEHRFKDLARPERVFQAGDQTFPPIRSLSPSNLPVPATPFLGRDAELARVGEMLAEPTTRVLTLTGPGGTGKTRLAIQAAAESSDRFPGGLWWVPLAPIEDAGLVSSEIAGSLGVEEASGSLADVLRARTQGRRTLVVLDNAEHLLPGLAEEIAPLTRNGAGATFLITSRERLRIEAEREFAVPSMSADDAEAFLISRAEAIGIHLERSPTLSSLAERLDRLPLAMQLAVARLKLFTVDKLLERLSTALDLTGERDTDPRQRTLRATIAWSHDLLDEDERALLRRMSVFSAGATIDAIEAICGVDVDVLLSLVDKSLVRRRDDVPDPRFWMLETIREFASERLGETGEAEELRQTHARWYAAWAHERDDEIHVVNDRLAVLRVMDQELDNVRSALAWAFDREAWDLLEALAGSFRMYWHLRGLYREGRRWYDLSYEHPSGDLLERVYILDGLTSIAYRQGDYDVALRIAEEALPLARESGSAEEILTAVTNVADGLSALGRHDEATRWFDEAVERARALGIPHRIAAALVNRGDMASIAGRYEQAVTFLAEALAYAREHAIPGAAIVAEIDLASTCFLLGRDEDAERYARGPSTASEISDMESIQLLILAGVRVRRGDVTAAARFLGASDGFRGRTGYGFEPAEQAVERIVRDALLEPMTDPAVRAVYERGKALDEDAARAFLDDAEPGALPDAARRADVP